MEIKKLLDNRFIVNGPTLIEDNRSAPTEQQSSSGSQLPKAVHLEPSRGLTEGNASCECFLGDSRINAMQK